VKQLDSAGGEEMDDDFQPDSEVRRRTAAWLADELGGLGAGEHEQQDVARLVTRYLEVYWTSKGLNEMADKNVVAFERHVRRTAVRYWFTRLRQCLPEEDCDGQSPARGPTRRWAKVSDEGALNARLDLFKMIDEADLPDSARIMLELIWDCGMNQIEAAAALGMSQDELVVDLRKAFAIIRGRTKPGSDDSELGGPS
jgi:hypothetical protein